MKGGTFQAPADTPSDRKIRQRISYFLSKRGMGNTIFRKGMAEK